jgi:hypothetical protein
MATPNNHPPFGPTLRGMRLGYRWSSRHGCFVRISDHAQGALIELAPIEIPSKTATKFHRAWWEGQDILSMIEPLRGVRKIKKPVSFVVDGSGQLTKGGAA